MDARFVYFLRSHKKIFGHVFFSDLVFSICVFVSKHGLLNGVFEVFVSLCVAFAIGCFF